jgi:uncharacterized FlaG/YvyC family protein
MALMKIESPPVLVVDGYERSISVVSERAKAGAQGQAASTAQGSSSERPAERPADKGRTAAEELAKDFVNEADPPAFKQYELSFRMDRDLRRVIVHVLDAETKEVVRSIPPEDVVRSLQRLYENSRGILVDQEG